MRIVRFIDDEGAVRYGRKHGDGSVTLLEGNLFETPRDTRVPASIQKILAPVEPTAILCIGLNYRQHAAETGAEIPQFPVLFMKNPAAVTNPEDPILLPSSCLNPLQVDYEAELAVVIGKPAKNVPVADAFRYILGYTAANDVSARWWQKHGGGGQWIRGKSFDAFCPLGPELVTTETITNPQKLGLRSILNNEVMQDGHTSDMIFSVAELIAFLSEDTTLLPGTVILTGTPSGVGFARNPEVYLKPGDTVEVHVEGIDPLVNPVVAAGES